MSEESNQPTVEDLRAARREGFANSVGHMAEDQRGRFQQSYETQDTRREENIRGFHSTIVGDGK